KSQTFTVRSALAEARRRPSGLNATLVIQNECPLSTRTSWPEFASQIHTSPGTVGATRDRSPPPAARYLPSGLNATLLAQCGSRGRLKSSFPVEASQTFTSPACSLPLQLVVPLAEASRLPSGLNATLETRYLWAGMLRSSFPVAAS